MAYTEIRGDTIRVRWKLANGKYSGGVAVNEKTGEPFASEDEAKQYGEDQETLIRLGLRRDPDKITFGEWSTIWYQGLSLEPSTMRTYRSLLKGFLLPVFEPRLLNSLKAEEMDPWEQGIIRAGYAPRTAQDARRLMINILGDAVPRYLSANPAARKRGKGRKGVRRVQAYERAEKAWASPLEVILIAERAALLTGDPDVFVLLVLKAWSGMRWSEILSLGPEHLLKGGQLDIRVKLYELSGFYRGYPKDGSLRIIDIPAFLEQLLQPIAKRARTCSCAGRDAELPRVDGEEHVEWCTGRRYLFLTRGRGERAGDAHYKRGSFSGGVMRPAADGIHPAREDKRWPRPSRRVTVDVTPLEIEGEIGTGSVFPGRPLTPAWPDAVAGEEFVIPRRQGHWLYDPADEGRRHLASWLPIKSGLTPHGLRHGHQTWMDDGGIKKALKVERMGHEDTSMSGRYGHVTDGMREQLLELLEALWENGLAERFKISPHSPVTILDDALGPWREGTASKVVSQISPRNGRRARSA